MNLTNKDLKQIDEKYLLSLSRAELEKLSKKLLNDLRASRDRQNMNTEFSPLRRAQVAPEHSTAPRQAQ